MNNIGVFVDISRQYYAANQLDSRIDYSKYLDKIKGEGNVHCSYAYGVYIEDEAAPFITALKYIGFEPKYKPAKMIQGKASIRHTYRNLDIAMDVVRHIDQLSTVVLGSNDPELLPLIHWVREKGVKVMIYSLHIPNILRDCANVSKEMPNEVLIPNPLN